METKFVAKMVGIAEFKAKCERLISQMEQDGEPIELTRRGKVVGVLSLPAVAGEPKTLVSSFGLLKSDRYRDDLESEDWTVDPDWEAKWEAKWDERDITGRKKS